MSQNCCCVPECPVIRNDGVPLHRFPNPVTNAEKFQIWVTNIGGDIETLNSEIIYSNRRVCHKHFEDVYKYPKNRLSHLAIPILHMSSRFEEQVPENDSKIVENRSDRVAEQVPEHDSHIDKRQAELESIEPENDIFSREERYEPEFINEELENTVPGKDIFSWEARKEPELVHEDEAEHTDDVPCDLSMYCDDEPVPVTTKQLDRTGYHEGFHCDHCNGDIVGYRYTCVQCSDSDLCVSCESRGAHSHHYMLRVPAPRPYNEVQSVLARIRMYLMKQLDPISGPDLDNDDVVSVKSEVKSEDEAEDAEDIEQVDTLAEDTMASEADEHSRLSSPESQYSENSDSIVLFNEVVQESDKILKGKTQNFLRVSLPDNTESKLTSIAKRKNLEEVSGPVETMESNQLAKRICYQPSKRVQNRIVWDSKTALEGRRITFVKLPPGALLKQGEAVSLHIRPPKDPLTNITDLKT